MNNRILAEALDTLLACPVCHGMLKCDGSGDSEIRCLTCERRYPINDGIPVLFGVSGGAQRDEQTFRNTLATAQLNDSQEALVRAATRYHCESVMRKRAGTFCAQFGANRWVLDLGVGYGWHWVGAPGPAKIIGLDMSVESLRLAKKVLAADRDRVLLVCSDAAALPIRDQRIAGVWSVQVFQHFPNEVLLAVQEELDRVLSSEFAIEIHNLNPAALYRLAYFIVGKVFPVRGKTGPMERNCYTMKEWYGLWRGFRPEDVEMSGGYSELFFHPDLHLCLSPYPLLLEEHLVRIIPDFAALFARQVQVRIKSRDFGNVGGRLAAQEDLIPRSTFSGTVGSSRF